ncbi:acetate--CoA ligase [Lederbergia panacisoli]|uniref:acetate--CoA ligase n=1 Tax=Lederbergia panacisoli TaxID=1255251 RepID=UPI00214C8558|nr:acetate--CoA ligase [Lederbergia panacisoli]MCR2822145.1 acetate--CoA ligase [Lederbergia panacisoli]
MTRQKIIPPYDGSFNVKTDLDKHKVFNWDNVKKYFSWHKTGKVNMAFECVDRHVAAGFGEKVALHYISENSESTLTYRELKEATDRWATILKKHGVKKGDFLFVFLPKHPECHIAILAAIKLGAVVGPLFEAFMEEAIRDRISDCEGKYLITNEEYLQRVPLQDLPSLETIFLTDEQITTNHAISIPKELTQTEIDENVIEWVDLEDGLNIHYTSGSTGKPKGIIHAHRAMIQQYTTGRWVLDLKEDDVYWCTAHPGWVTGCVYGIFAPLLNRATIVLHGGRFNADSWYETIEKTGVTVWYSAPTAFRMLMAEGVETLKRYNVSSLRHILSVGEPLNPEIIYWSVGHLNLRIHDTWWMTETGAQLIVNLPTEPIKPGSMGKPLPTIETAILDDDGNPLPVGEVGHLAIKGPWPSIMKEVWRNEKKYQSYFPFGPNWYLSGDLALKDEEGYIFFQGRSDDMINSSGERIGPFEVESKLIEHPAVAEAGVVGKPDFIRGEIVKAFIVLKKGYTSTPELLANIRLFVRNRLAAHAAPREIEVIEELPKTKISGKILRRELKAREIEKLKAVEV